METVNITGENIRIYWSIAFFFLTNIQNSSFKQKSFDRTVYLQLTHVLIFFGGGVGRELPNECLGKFVLLTRV